jgi:hypothetical protein
MADLDFSVEGKLDEPRFNRVLWSGLRGEDVPFPTERHGRDLRHDRRTLLEAHRLRAGRAVQTSPSSEPNTSSHERAR